MTPGNEFNIRIAATHGFPAISATDLLDKENRAQLMLSMVEVDEEKNQGHLNWQVGKFSDPANVLLWPNSTFPVFAPRGGYAGWSQCVPAYHDGLNNYLPVENEAGYQTDDDYNPLNINAVRQYGTELPEKTLAFVSATTEHGNQQPIASLSGGPLVADWRGPRSPRMSRHLFDINTPGELDPLRHAGLHTIFKVQEWVPPCSTNTSSSSNWQKQFSIAITANLSPDGTGYWRATFGPVDGLFSHLVSGAFKPSFKEKHLLSVTGDGDIVAGGISTNAYFVGSTNPFTAPLRFWEEPYPVVQDGMTPYEVFRKYDANLQHPFYCGQKPGMWREYVNLPIGETPPCTPTKDYSTVDANENPRRTFMSSALFTNKHLISQGIRFQPRVNLTAGRKPVFRRES